MDLRKEIIEYIGGEKSKNADFSQSKLEAKLGINKTYLSQYLNNDNFKYKDKVEEKFKVYLQEIKEKGEVKERIKGLSKLDFIQTKDAKKIFARLVLASMQGDRISVILGESGTGKSRIIEEFCKGHTEAICIEATPDMNAKDILNKLASTLNLGIFKSNHSGIVMIAKELKRLKKYVIVDEADHLRRRELETIRRIMDFSVQPLMLVDTN